MLVICNDIKENLLREPEKINFIENEILTTFTKFSQSIPIKIWRKERKLSLVHFWQLAFLVPENAVCGGRKAKTVKKMSGVKIIHQICVDGA